MNTLFIFVYLFIYALPALLRWYLEMDCALNVYNVSWSRVYAKLEFCKKNYGKSQLTETDKYAH